MTPSYIDRLIEDNGTDAKSVPRSAIAAALLLDQPALRWMTRRKLAVDLIDEETHRKQLCVDVSIPESLALWLQESGAWSVPVPFTALFKEARHARCFDFSASGAALQLPTREQNLSVSGDIMLQQALLIERTHSVSNYAKEVARVVGLGESDQAISDGIPYVVDTSIPGHLADNRVYRWLTWRLLEKALVVADLPVADRRSTIKLSFLDWNRRDSDEAQSIAEAAGWQPFKLKIMADLWPGSTFHYESLAPSGLEVIDAQLTRWRSLNLSETRRNKDAPRSFRPVDDNPCMETAAFRRGNRGSGVHLYCPRNSGQPIVGEGFQADLAFRARRGGFVSNASLASLFNFFLVAWLLLVIGVGRDIEATVAVLLGGVGFGASFAVQAIGGALAAHLLRVVRRALVVSMTAVLMATVLFVSLSAVQLPDNAPFWEQALYHGGARFAMLPFALVSLGSAGIIWLARSRPRSPTLDPISEGRVRLEAWVETAVGPLVRRLERWSVVDLDQGRARS